MEKRKRFNLFNRSEMDLTSGNLFLKIILFALPIILTSVLQLLYTSADLVIVQYFGGGDTSMSAVGMNGSLVALFINVFLGLSVGANVCMGNTKGANDKEKGGRVLHSSLLLAIISGCLCLLIGMIGAPFFLTLMNTPDLIYDKAVLYLRVYFIGLPFLMVINFGSALLRALGDSKSPLIVLFITGVVNVLLNLLFTAVFKWDVAGVGIATVISELVGAAWIFILLGKKRDFASFHIKDFKLSKAETIEIIKIGLPAGIQSFLFSISNVIIQSEANKFGEVIIAGNTASNNIESYIFAVAAGITQSCVAFVSQNYGAKKKKNLDKVLIYCLILTAVLTSAAGWLAILFQDNLLSLFTQDPSSIEAGEQRLLVMASLYFTCGLMNVFCGYLQGMKYSISPALITLFGSVILRIVFIYGIYQQIPEIQTLNWLYFAYPASWTITTIFYFVVVLFLRPHSYKKIDNNVVDNHDAIAPLPFDKAK